MSTVEMLCCEYTVSSPTKTFYSITQISYYKPCIISVSMTNAEKH